MTTSFSGQHPDIYQSLSAAGQTHILTFWGDLTPEEQSPFLEQIQSIDLDLLNTLYGQYQRRETTLSRDFRPVQTVSRETLSAAEIDQAVLAGETHLREGKVALILVAGGQGSRLGFSGPKGCYPLLDGKTLFHIFADNIATLNQRYGVALDWCIMTSQATDRPTRDFFKQHNFFGLPPATIHFFQQDMLPSLDFEGKLILDAKNHIAENPNGHGGTLLALRKNGLLALFQQKGIEQLFYFQVDNALTRIADPLFIGLHASNQAEMSTKVVRKITPDEKVGLVGYVNDRLGVIEYSELSVVQAKQKNPDGSLVFNAANTAIHMLRTDFVARIAETAQLPYHVAIKKIPYIPITHHPSLITPQKPNGIKFETFIFDALGNAKQSVTLEVNRQEEFAPLKNAAGPDSAETVRQALKQ